MTSYGDVKVLILHTGVGGRSGEKEAKKFNVGGRKDEGTKGRF